MVNWKNVLGTSVLSAGLLFSSFGSFGSTASAQTLKDSALKSRNSVVHIDKQKSLPFLKSAPGSTFDPGLVNEDKVLEMLIKEGKVSKNASKAKQLEQAQTYFRNRSAKAEQLTHTLGLDNPKQVRSNIQEQQGLQKKPAKAPNSNSTLNLFSTVKGTSVNPIHKENWDGAVRTDKVLVLLIEYPDFPHNSITPDDDPVLLYNDFTRQHYQDMIFGKNGYSGPNEEDYISVKQFYEQQSGGSYTIDGQVSQWYMAKNPASFYGGNNASGSDSHPRDLIKEALDDAAQDPSINLADYDQEDPFDLDGDGNLREPDGIIDHLMVVHSGVGEEAGGGSLGDAAIWSHSSQVYDLINGAAYPYQITGTDYYAWGYTVEPEDGAAGVFAHEYGHNLGLPDDYDTQYTQNGVGAPTGFWTIMSSGSWGGTVPGTEPTGFAAKDKEFLQESMPGSNWFRDKIFNLNDLKSGTQLVNLDEASVKGTNADGIRINLPDKETVINTPTSGTYEYFGGGVDGESLYMTTSNPVDLTNATNASLAFKTWYSIEQDYDYAYVAVSDDNGNTWTNIPGNITTTNDPNSANQGNGITGDSNGWQDATFDLSSYAGKQILVCFEYAGDPYVHQAGFYLDDINITADGQTVLSDNADSDTSSFDLEGFTKDSGKNYTEQYYLIEWRNYADADTALEHINRGGQIMSYEPGMIVWYYDSSYGDDNWVGYHPGDGFLGVVDAHQTAAMWTGAVTGAAGTDYQIADASFSLNPTNGISLDLSENYGRILSLDPQPAATVFDDSRDYSEPEQPYAGRNVPNFGLKVHVVGQADDMSVGQLALHVGDDHSITLDTLSTDKYSGADGHNNVTISGTLHEDGNGESVAVKYDLVDSNNNIVQTSEEETVDGLYQTFSHTFMISSNLASGEYKVKVTATDVDGNSQSADEIITVDNTAPTVTPEWPNGNNTGASSKDVSVKVVLPNDVNPTTLEYVWFQSAKAPVSGWTSFNNGDTLTLAGKDGTWYLHVRAQDKVGNPVNWTSDAFTVDNTAPVLTLKGDNPLTVEQGSKFKDPGFIVRDNVDNNLASKVVVTGTVDTSKVGEYTLTYTVTDAAGNRTVVTRTVKVVKKSTNNGGTNNGGTTNNGSGSNGGTTSGSSNLPTTATDMFNLMTGGILSIALAAALLFVSRRRKCLI